MKTTIIVVSRVMLVLCLTSLYSCSYIRLPASIQNRDKHYLEARSIPPLKIPPGLSSDKFDTAYPVSDRVYPGNPDVSLVPPGIKQ